MAPVLNVAPNSYAASDALLAAGYTPFTVIGHMSPPRVIYDLAATNYFGTSLMYQNYAAATEAPLPAASGSDFTAETYYKAQVTASVS